MLSDMDKKSPSGGFTSLVRTQSERHENNTEGPERLGSFTAG